MENIEYIKRGFSEQELKSGCFRNWDGVCDVLTYPFIQHMSKYINFDDVKIILDIGSRDACQSLELNRWFPNAKIFAFEPVPSSILWCENATKDIDNITIVHKAINSYNGKTKFFEVTNGNVGASSLLTVSSHPRSRVWQQREIEVDCVNLEDWLKENLIDKVDLLWVDVQGAEEIVYKSMGEYLKNVDGIATEVALQALYNNSTLKIDLDEILNKNFSLLESKPEPSNTEADAIYVNKKHI